MTTQILHIPNWWPTRLNTLLSSHWRKSSRMKNSDMQMIAVYAHKNGITKAAGKRLVEIIITVDKSRRGKAPDADAFYKSTWDALVTARLLIDDNNTYLDHKPTIVQRGEGNSTTIKLTDIATLTPGNARGSVYVQRVKPIAKKKVEEV